MISVKKVTVSYGKEKLALSDLDLEINGSIAVLGDDGAGKTTLAKLICGYVTPKTGEITVNGSSPKENTAANAVGYMPQDCHLSPTLSVSETLAFTAKLRNIDVEEIKQASQKARLTASETSAPVGMLGALAKKKALLAYALLGSPEFLVVDQPLCGLEYEDEESLLELLSDLSAEYKLVYLTDSVSEARSISNRALLLSKGRSVGFGDIEEILCPQEETAVYKGKARGDKEALRAVLEGCEAITKHKVSITASGSALIELTGPSEDGFKDELSDLMCQADCKLTELRKVDSPAKRVVDRLLEKQAEKDECRRIKAEEKAPPVKLTAELLSLRHTDENDENDRENTDTNKANDKAELNEEKAESSLFGLGSLLSIHRESTEEADGEEDTESTLFSSRDDV